MKASQRYLAYVGVDSDKAGATRFANGDWLLATDTGSLYHRVDGAWVSTSPEMGDASVTNAMLANMAQNTVKGRISSGTGVPEDLTAANLIAILTGADGTGSLLDADKLDSHETSYFATASHTHAAADTDWVQQTITGANWNAGSYCYCRKIGNVVWLKAYMLEAANTPGSPALTLDAQFRPVEIVWLPGLNSNTNAYYKCTIATDGTVAFPGNDSASGQVSYVHGSWLTADAPEGGAGAGLPPGVAAGDLIRFDGDVWYVESEPATFQGIVLTPATAALLDAEGAMYYNSTQKSILVCTGV